MKLKFWNSTIEYNFVIEDESVEDFVSKDRT
jgi:hypothetical protein